MVKLLVKNRLSQLFASMMGKRRGSVKKASLGKTVGFSILFLLLLACFLILTVSMSIGLGSVLIPLGAEWLYFAIFMLATVSVLFIFSIFETKSELFECKDNDLLLSLPIKPRSIVLSRITVILIYNYLEELIIMLPCIAVYAYFARSAVGVIGGIIVSLFLPLLATSLASAVGYLVAVISKKLHKNSFVTVAVSIVFLVAYFWGYSSLIENMDKIAEYIENDLATFATAVPALYHIGAAAILKPINLLGVILVSLLFASVAYFVISKNYKRIVTDTKSESRAKYKGEHIKAKSALSALVRKELRKFISSSTYMLNGGLGTVFSVAVGVVALLNRSTLLSIFSELSVELGISGESVLSSLMICALIFVSSTNMMSASALSLEGKNLWCVKIIPVSDKVIMLSKVIPQIIITLPPTVLASVMLIIASNAPIEYWAFFILTPAFANIFFAILGMVMNTAFPKFDFENEVQPIKQSMSVFLVMMIQMLLSLAFLVLNFILSILNLGVVSAFLTLGVLAGLSVLFYFILVGPCTRKYSSLDV